MVMRQYNTASHFAKIIRTLGYLYEDGEDVDDLLHLIVKAGINALNGRHLERKCSSNFLVDALMFELHSNGPVTKASAHFLLKAIDLAEQLHQVHNAAR